MAIAQQAQQPNQYQTKPKKPRFAHTANTKYGMGDYYGTGIKAKIGTMRNGLGSVGMAKLNKKQLGTPPKSLV